MRREFRYLCVVGASALLFFGFAPNSLTGLGPSDSLAQGNSGGSHGKSGDSPGHTDGGPGNSGSTPSASNSNKSNSSIVHQLAADSNMSMGELSRVLKSWRSIGRANPAYEANVGNLNSLPGRQLAYAGANQGAQDALSNFNQLVTLFGASYTTDSPPTLDEYNAALTALAGADAQTVVQDLTNAYTAEQYSAAETVVIYEAWDAYQTAESGAEAAFMATLPGNQNGAVYDENTYGSLRTQVNELIALRGL
jgi:hypothetical protein